MFDDIQHHVTVDLQRITVDAGTVLMQQGEKPLDAVSLIFVSSPTSILVTFLMFWFLESPRFFEWTSEAPASRQVAQSA